MFACIAHSLIVPWRLMTSMGNHHDRWLVFRSCCVLGWRGGSAGDFYFVPDPVDSRVACGIVVRLVPSGPCEGSRALPSCISGVPFGHAPTHRTYLSFCKAGRGLARGRLTQAAAISTHIREMSAFEIPWVCNHCFVPVATKALVVSVRAGGSTNARPPPPIFGLIGAALVRHACRASSCGPSGARYTNRQAPLSGPLLFMLGFVRTEQTQQRHDQSLPDGAPPSEVP